MVVKDITRIFFEIFLIFVISLNDMTNGGVQGPIDGYNSLAELTTPQPVSYTNPKWVEPYFDAATLKNVTALVGKSAYLSCRVRNLGNKTVSWIRHRDIHILTVGAYTYTSDQRFQATYHKETEDWTLQIKWAQKRDGGMYECQISTQPVRSYFVRLNVVVPTATILGGPDLHVDKGSTINLTCTVKYSPEPPAYIFWYHHEEDSRQKMVDFVQKTAESKGHDQKIEDTVGVKVINYDSSRGGVSVITEKGDVTTSFLLIQNADLPDSGKYSCAPSNADVASVRVHVLNGEHPEAMQTGTSGCQYSWLNICLLLGMLVYCNKQILKLNYLSSTSHLNRCNPHAGTTITSNTTLTNNTNNTTNTTSTTRNSTSICSSRISRRTATSPISSINCYNQDTTSLKIDVR